VVTNKLCRSVTVVEKCVAVWVKCTCQLRKLCTSGNWNNIFKKGWVWLPRCVKSQVFRMTERMCIHHRTEIHSYFTMGREVTVECTEKKKRNHVWVCLPQITWVLRKVEEINPRFLLTWPVITSVNLTYKTTNGHRFELIFLIILVVYKVGKK
jgi:hypothetical protein